MLLKAARFVGFIMMSVCILLSRHAVADEAYIQGHIQGHIQGIAPFYEGGAESYRAALYVNFPQSSITAEQALVEASAMAFRIVRARISARAWMRDLSQRAAINNDLELIHQCSAGLLELGSLIKAPLLAGDIVKLSRDGATVKLDINNVDIGYVEQEGLFELLLNAWIGWVPPSSEFKRRLLSERVTINQGITFESQDDVAARKQRTRAWLEAGSQEIANQTTSIVATGGETGFNEVHAQIHSVELASSIVVAPELPSASVAIGSEALDKRLEPEPEPEPEPESEPSVLNQITAENAHVQNPEHEVHQAADFSEEDAQPIEEERKQLERLANFRQNLQTHPMRFVSYPARSQAKREEGVVGLLVTIARDGEVIDVSLDSSSSFSRLDRAAMQAVKKASPFPSIPEQLSGERLEFVIPFAFRLQ